MIFVVFKDGLVSSFQCASVEKACAVEMRQGHSQKCREYHPQVSFPPSAKRAILPEE